MGIKSWFSRTKPESSSTTFSAPQNTNYYSMAMALESGLISGDGTSREAALSVPAVLKGRNMICNVATIPLTLLDAARATVDSPLFEQFDPDVANVVHLAMTIEDLVFDGVGWWEVTSRDAFGFPLTTRHTDSRRVNVQPPSGYNNPLPSGVDPSSVIWIDGKARNGREYIRFDSPNPPLLVAAKRAIARAVALEDTATMYAGDPRALDYFTPAEGTVPLTEAEVREALAGWIAARKKRATGYVPETLKYNTVQVPNPQELQLVSLLQSAKLDIANAIGVDPEDLGISTTSRTYQNDTSRNQNRVNDVLSGYMRAITDRLSMPDVTRSGHKATFILDDYLKADPATRWEIHERALGMGATDVAEIREDEKWVKREDLNKPEPVTAPTNTPVAPAVEESMSKTFADVTPQATFRFDTADHVTFATDTEKRTITGTAMLYDTPAENGEGKFTFARGSLTWNKSAVSRVKFLRDHDWDKSVGAATVINDLGDKVNATFKVARGPQGDQALSDAEDLAADGLSVGIDIVEYQEMNDGGYYVTKALLNEVSLTPRPAFEDARLTKVNASKTTPKESTVTEENTPVVPADLDEKIATAVAAAFAKGNEKPAKDANGAPKADEKAGTVNPVRPLPSATFEVAEKSPYRFDRAGRFIKGEQEFSTDLVEMIKRGDTTGKNTEFGKRAMAHITQNFVATGDVNELNPAIQQPEKYYEAPGIRTPLWDLINKGGLPNGVQPFTMPKFASASGLVADHVEGVEPATGTFVTTSQTITPTALSGKVTVNREVIDMGGNPAVSNLIWNRIQREYREGLETASAAFLATLTAATNIDLPGGASDTTGVLLRKAIKSMIVSLNFLPGYSWDAFAVEQNLYEALANLEDSTGRPVYPVLNPTNADGQAASLWQTLNLGGLAASPAPGLAHTVAAENSSWLFDREVVHGYASAPERFEFAGSGAANIYTPVATVDIAVFGYKAFANIDIAGVRQVTYDTDEDNTP